MNSGPPVGLVINTYEQPDYLWRVLQGVSHQVIPPAEVLLADDGSTKATGQLFTHWALGRAWRCHHLWHPHLGFRRARILNAAIAASRAEYLVFLDGDTVPHPQFIADHARLARLGRFVQGHRALIGPRAAARFGTGSFHRDRLMALMRLQLSGLQNAFRWPRPFVRARDDLQGIRGCNLGIWRKDLETINGYNEQFLGWGREDSELAVRLKHLGTRRHDVRGWAICYHLWHPPASREGLGRNDALLERAVAAATCRCEQGLAQHTPQPRPDL